MVLIGVPGRWINEKREGAEEQPVEALDTAFKDGTNLAHLVKVCPRPVLVRRVHWPSCPQGLTGKTVKIQKSNFAAIQLDNIRKCVKVRVPENRGCVLMWLLCDSGAQGRGDRAGHQ